MSHRGESESRERWWATLAPDALADETTENRRGERWVTVTGTIAAVVTIALILLVGGLL